MVLDLHDEWHVNLFGEMGQPAPAGHKPPLLNEAAQCQVASSKEAFILDETTLQKTREALIRRYGSAEMALANRSTILNNAVVAAHGSLFETHDFPMDWLGAGLSQIIPKLGAFAAHDLEGILKRWGDHTNGAWDIIRRAGDCMAPYFAEVLLKESSRNYKNGFGGCVAAGILSNDVACLQELTKRIREGSDNQVNVALEMAAHMDERAARTYPALFDAILDRLPTVGPVWNCTKFEFNAIMALKGAGRNQPATMDWLESAYWCEPQFVGSDEDELEPTQREAAFDDLMNFQRGNLVEALGYQSSFPDRAVTWLADALDQFEEYDPDWEYDGVRHRRVAEALQRFGTDTAPALASVMEALKRLTREDDPSALLDVLWVMGDAAAPALSVVERIVYEGEVEVDDSLTGSAGDDDVSCLLARLRKCSDIRK